MSIHYLKNTEINTKAWDNCITGSFNGRLHASSWYLDLICEKWDALVEDHYKSVMPLIIKRFWGQEIIDLPLFSHELGIFSGEPINAAKTRNFIDSIPARFRYYRILLNKYNPLESDFTHAVYRKKYELDLIKPYHRLAEDFKPSLRAKLNLAMSRKYTLVKGLTPHDLIGFITGHKIHTEITAENNYKLLQTITTGLIRYKSGELYGIYDQNHDLACIALFSWFISRLYLQFHVTAPGHANNYPVLFLIDRFIEKYAETNSTLSFEYPEEEENQEIYNDFAANESRLVQISRNRLPVYLKLLPLP